MLSTDLPHERKPVPTALKNVDIVWCWVLGVRCLAKGCKWQKKEEKTWMNQIFSATRS